MFLSFAHNWLKEAQLNFECLDFFGCVWLGSVNWQVAAVCLVNPNDLQKYKKTKQQKDKTTKRQKDKKAKRQKGKSTRSVNQQVAAVCFANPKRFSQQLNSANPCCFHLIHQNHPLSSYYFFENTFKGERRFLYIGSKFWLATNKETDI